MAPFHGPSLVGALRQLARGAQAVSVGRGIPAAELRREGEGYAIVAFGGGAGFGVTPDHDPIVRADEQRVADLGELARCWQPSFGPAFEDGETLEIQFTPAPEVLAALRTLALPIAECSRIAKSGRYTVTSLAALIALAGVRLTLR